MANKKYKLANNDYWATDGVYDFGQSKTQRQINSDLNGAINDKAKQAAIAILANGNTHIAIGRGQLVYVKNHGTLSEGLYRAVTSISANAQLTTANLSTASNGGFNEKPVVYAHANNSANFVGGTTTLENTGIVSTQQETYVVFLKIHASANGTIKININDAPLFDITATAGMDYVALMSRTVSANTQVQIQFLSSSTGSVSSYYIICIPTYLIGV